MLFFYKLLWRKNLVLQLPTIYKNFNHLFPVKSNTHRLGNGFWLGLGVWLEQLNACAKKKYLFYWINFVNYIKLFKIQGTRCYDVNVKFLSFQKDDLLKYVKFRFRHVFSFSRIWKKKFSEKFSKKLFRDVLT